ncbi:MAG: serine/threonine protein kinase [Deltaproteobacteria bacterium]|nr:serine/threonine protein kinase [Deltaproteobacteria bacterium]
MGAEIGRYELIARLAAGGMGEIWLARQRSFGGFTKIVALKRLLPQLARDPAFVGLFAAEARLAAQLTHAGIAQIYDLDQIDGTCIIAMELVHGENVQLLQRRTWELRGEPLAPRLAAHIVADAARALHHAHTAVDIAGRSLGLLHRDMSPSNILVSYAGDVKLVDFGIARALAETPVGVGGKLAYASPEQCQGVPLDARTDIFSLGVVLWELLTGRRLFGGLTDAETRAAITAAAPVKRADAVRAELPAALADVAAKALARDREARFGSALELAQALDAWLASGGGDPGRDELAAVMGALFRDRKDRWAALLGQAKDGPSEAGEEPVAAASAAGIHLGEPDPFDESSPPGPHLFDGDGDLAESTLPDAPPVMPDPPPGAMPRLVVPPPALPPLPPEASTRPSPRPTMPEPPAPAPPVPDPPRAPAPPSPSSAAPAGSEAPPASATDRRPRPVADDRDDLPEPAAVAARLAPRRASTFGVLPGVVGPSDGFQPSTFVDEDDDDDDWRPIASVSRALEQAPVEATPTAPGQPLALEVLRLRDGKLLGSQVIRPRGKRGGDAVVPLAGGLVSARLGQREAVVTLGAGVVAKDGGAGPRHLALGDSLALAVGAEELRVRAFTPPPRPKAGAVEVVWGVYLAAIVIVALAHLATAPVLDGLEALGVAVTVTEAPKEVFVTSQKPRDANEPPKPKPKPKPRPKPPEVAKKIAVPKPAPTTPPPPVQVTSEQAPQIPKSVRKKLAAAQEQSRSSSSSATAQLLNRLTTPKQGTAQAMKDVTTSIEAKSAGRVTDVHKVMGEIAAAGGEPQFARSSGAEATGPLAAGAPGEITKKIALEAPKADGKVRGKVSSMSVGRKVSGELDPGDVYRVIDGSIGKIQQCYERELRTKPSLSGKITFRWTVTEAGSVTAVREVTSTLGDPAVSACIQGVLKRLRFPKPKGGTVEIDYPFIFRSS